MSALQKLNTRIKEKGLRATFNTLWKRYVFFHSELLWLGRDLVSPVSHTLKPYPPVRLELITVQNADAFARYFGNRVEVMRELAAEGYTGHMYLDDQGDAVGFIWGSKRDYHDRHFYGCWFPVKDGEFFQFGGEVIPAYWGTSLTADAQFAIWNAMHVQGCTKVVDVCDIQNIQAIKMHMRMDYLEQGRITHVYALFGRWRFYRETRYSGSRLDALRKSGRPDVAAPAT